MYGLLSRGIDPNYGRVYGIPREMIELRRQLSLVPRIYDREGRLWLPPKNKPPGRETGATETLIDIIGRSPDEADSAVLCYYALVRPQRRVKAGVT